MVGTVAMFSREARHCDLLRSSRRFYWLPSLLRAVGVVTFLLSVASPYDDAVQQEAFRPKSSHVAIKRLPSATTGTHKSAAVPPVSLVSVSKASAMPVVLRDVEPDTVTLLAIRSRSDLPLRSPPPIR